MMNNKDEPIEMKINYVRVYQNKNDPKQKVGCSTPERPTSQYIKGHAELYKRNMDVRCVAWSNFIPTHTICKNVPRFIILSLTFVFLYLIL